MTMFPAPNESTRATTAMAHYVAFALYFAVACLWIVSLQTQPIPRVLVLALLVAWLSLRVTASAASIMMLGIVVLRYGLWDSKDSWLTMAQVTMATCLLLASRVQFCEMLHRLPWVMEFSRRWDNRFLMAAGREVRSLAGWTVLAGGCCVLASFLLLKTVGSRDEWLQWAQQQRVVLWPHPTLIVVGWLGFLMFKRWQWSLASADVCRLRSRSEAIEILSPDLGRVARSQSAIRPGLQDVRSEGKPPMGDRR